MELVSILSVAVLSSLYYCTLLDAYSVLVGWTASIFKFSLHLGHNCTSVKFCDDIFIGCDIITLRKSAHNHINTWQRTQTFCCGSSSCDTYL